MEGNYYSFGLTVGKLKVYLLTNFDVFWEETYTFPLCEHLRS